jgi:cytochrome P450
MLDRLSALPGGAPLLLLAALPMALFLAYRYVYYLRFQQFAHIPQLPSSLLWGHLATMGKLMGREKPRRDADEAFKAAYHQLGRPPLVLFDMRPLLTRPMVVVTSHEVAEQISKPSKGYPWALPKSPTLSGLVPLIGHHSILTGEAEEWKALRKRFNPGFSPTHLMTLLPCILDKTHEFLRHLDDYCASGDDFASETLLVNLTFDIIGKVVMDVDFGAQETKEKKGELIRLYSDLLETYSEAGPVPFESPLTTYKRRKIARRVDEILRANVQRKFNELKASRHGETSSSTKDEDDDASATATRNITSLSLQDVDTLDDYTLQATCDQLKTFLLAGHDTTAILMQWAFYEFTRSPDVKAKIVAELDELFGPDTDPESVRDQLLAHGDELVRRMAYTSAVVKELLRMYAPAGTARVSRPNSGFSVHLPDGRDVCLDGVVIYNCANIIQRDPDVYGDKADVFWPDRWLGNADTSMRTNTSTSTSTSTSNSTSTTAGAGNATATTTTTTTGIPPSAWRPFERGPRNCIGQELANIEARVILACCVRRYDFVKVGRGELVLDGEGRPVLNDRGQYEVKSEMYSYRQVTPKPVDGMRMRVRLSERALAEAAGK